MQRPFLWSTFVLMFFFVAVAFAERSKSQWESLPDMPLGVFNAAVSQVGPLVVITGGINQGGMASDIVQVFDLETQGWATPMKTPIGLCYHTQSTLGDGRVLVAGGKTGNVSEKLTPVADCFILDLQSGTVTPTNPLLKPAAGPTSHRLPDGTVIVVGGATASIFDPATDKWMEHVRLRKTRRSHASTVLPDGRVLVVGGIGRRSIEMIQPRKGVSKKLGVRLPVALDDLQVVTLSDNRVWIIGGQKPGGNTTDQTWMLDFNTTPAQLTEGPPLGVPDGVSDACIAVINSWVIIAGGESQRSKKRHRVGHR